MYVSSLVVGRMGQNSIHSFQPETTSACDGPSFLTTEVPSRSPKTHRKPNHKCRNITAIRGVFPRPGQSVAATPSSLGFQPRELDITSPLALSTPHLRSAANTHSRAGEPSLHVPSRICLQTQTRSPDGAYHPRYSPELSMDYFSHFQKSNLPSQKTRQKNVAQTSGRIPK